MTEKVSNLPLLVYVPIGLINKSLDKIREKLGIDEFDTVIRPIYGLKLTRAPNEQPYSDMLEFYQYEATKLTKEYYYHELSENSRLYINQHEEKCSVMLVSDLPLKSDIPPPVNKTEKVDKRKKKKDESESEEEEVEEPYTIEDEIELFRNIIAI